MQNQHFKELLVGKCRILNKPSLGCFVCFFLLYIWNLDLLKCYNTGTTKYYFNYCLIII